MMLVIIIWVELFTTFVLRWLLLNERLNRTIRARRPDAYLGRDELTDLLANDPKEFVRSAPREWLKGLEARTERSTDPAIEQDRTRGNRGYLALVAYLFLGTPLVIAIIGILGRGAPVLLAIVVLAVQAVLLTYSIRSFLGARRAAEPDNLAGPVALAVICVVVVSTGLAAFLLISRP